MCPEKFYDLCKEILELKPLNSSDLIKPSDAIVRLDNFMKHYSPRPYHDILNWFVVLRDRLKIRKQSPEDKIVDYFYVVMEDKDNERIQEIPLFLKVQYLYSVLEYEIIASKPKSIVGTSALIYDLLIVLNQIKRPRDYNTFNNKDKYDRVKRYLEIDKSTGMYKMMI